MSKDKTFRINILVHSLILLIFLSILFWIYIKNVERDKIDEETTKLINEQIPSVLSKIDEIDVNKKFNWDKLKNIAINLENKSQGSDETIKRKNNNLLVFTIFINVFLLVGIIIYSLILKSRGDKINIKHILIENLFIFIIIGIIEFNFFQNVVAKYVPVSPDSMISNLIDTTKENLLGYF